VTADLTVADTATITVSPSTRAKLLRLLVMGKGLDDAAVDCGLPDTVAYAVASGAGWPNLARVGEVLGRPVGAVEVPAPREPEPDPEPAELAVEDHPAVERALSLARLVREKDADAVARLTGGWSQADLLDVCLALASLLPAPLDPEVALAWLDLPAREWPVAVLRVEVARWGAGCRDRTASEAWVEWERRGL
jgi:hypothetical protein